MYSHGHNDDDEKSNLGIRDEGGKKTVHALSAGTLNSMQKDKLIQLHR